MGVCAMGLLTPEKMLEEILVLYQEVYKLKSDPGGVQCSTGAAEEAHTEVQEVFKACLQHRQGSSWPEEPRWTPRTWAEVEYHDQTWVGCDCLSFFQTWQQWSREEALRVAREAQVRHCLQQQCLRGILNASTAPPPMGDT